MNNPTPKHSFPTSTTVLRGIISVGISLSTILGVQLVAQAPNEQEAIASETYPGCDTSDFNWGGDAETRVESLVVGTIQRTSIQSVTFSASDRYLAAGDTSGIVYLWEQEEIEGDYIFVSEINNVEDLLPSEEYQRAPLPPGVNISITPFAHTLAFSPDEKFLVSGNTNGVLAVWEITEDSLRLVSTHIEHSINPTNSSSVVVRASSFTRDGHLVTAGDDKYIRVWSFNDDGSLDLVQEMPSNLQVKSISISADGKYVAASGTTNDTSPKVVEIWELETGERATELGPYEKNIYAVAFHPCQANLLAFSPDSSSNPQNEFRLEYTNTIELWDISENEQVEDFRLQGHEKQINALSFSPNGNYLISGSADQSIRIWDIRTGTQIYEEETSNLEQVGANAFIGEVLSVDFNTLGNRFAVGAIGRPMVFVVGLMDE